MVSMLVWSVIDRGSSPGSVMVSMLVLECDRSWVRALVV